MTKKAVLVLTIVAIGFFSSVADAKVIRPSAEKGENKVYLRVDGLACFFCAFGLERFFTKSGHIAWYDMDMKEGIIEVGFAKGKPILSMKILNQYVHDAGFSPREMKAEFVGRLLQSPDGSYRFEVTETAQTFPVEANEVVKASREAIGREVTIIARATEDPHAPLRLVPEEIHPR